MNRLDLREQLDRVDDITVEMNTHVPIGESQTIPLRADLAGLLVVLATATYENCVKQVLISYAGRHSRPFQIYTEQQYEKINSRISINDLRKYAKTFHPTLGVEFKSCFKEKKKYFLERASVDIEDSYDQILNWRHVFAHTGSRVTTIEEVLKHHHYGKRVIYIFADCFSKFSAS